MRHAFAAMQVAAVLCACATAMAASCGLGWDDTRGIRLESGAATGVLTSVGFLAVAGAARSASRCQVASALSAVALAAVLLDVPHLVSDTRAVTALWPLVALSAAAHALSAPTMRRAAPAAWVSCAAMAGAATLGPFS